MKGGIDMIFSMIEKERFSQRLAPAGAAGRLETEDYEMYIYISNCG